jgi:hypothetical protein
MGIDWGSRRSAPPNRILTMQKRSNKFSNRRSHPYRRPRPRNSLTSLSRVAPFRLVDNSNPTQYLGSNGSGVIAGYQNADPSGGSGSTWTSAEWSALTSLYSEVRLRSFEIWFTPVSPEDTKLPSTSAGNILYVSGVLSSIAAAPTTRAQVLDNADAKIWTPLSSTTGRPFVHKIRPRGRPQWASVTSASPGSYAGCPGAIQWYGDGFPVSTNLMAISMIGYYEFRSRI